jgi:DNA-binding CsgD family transcriptional regulator
MGQRPRLALDSAWLSLFVERTDLADKVNLVRQALAATSHTRHADDSWPYELLVLEACAAFYQSQGAAALNLAQQALEVTPPQYALERGMCHLLHLIYIRQHHIAGDEIRHADQAIANFTRAGFAMGVVSTMRTKALVLYDQGRAAEAVQTFYHQLEFARNLPSQLGIEVVFSRLDFGLVLYALNRIAEARQQFELLLEASRRINDPAFSLCAIQWLQLCERALNPQLPVRHTNLAQEEESLREIFAARSPALAWQACRAVAILRRSEHNPAGAWAAVQCTPINVHQEPAPGRMIMFVIYAHAYLGRGRALGALVPHLQRWEALLEDRPNLVTLKLQFRILAALLYSTQGNHMGALRALDEALTLIARSGYVRFALDYAEQLRPLLERSSHPLAQSILAEAEAVGQRKAAPLLSEVELRVLRHMAGGTTRQEAAVSLFLSENTIKTHLKRIYGKLGATSRDAALTKARELGLLDA